MTTNDQKYTNPNTAVILADSLTPLLRINQDGNEDLYILWLDFLLEVQAQLMTTNPSESFAFCCAENFGALRQTLGILADHKINLEKLEEIKKQNNLANEN